MKNFLYFRSFAYLASIILLLSILQYNISNPLMCEPMPNESDNNLFYCYDQKGPNLWDVVFKNVNIRYMVSSGPQMADGSYSFRFRELTRNSTNPVDQTIVNNSISNAVMAHFNSIQRGDFHPNTPNVINPNSHGRGINDALEQFDIRFLISMVAPIIASINVSITNIGVYLVASVILTIILNFLVSNLYKLIPSSWSATSESMYATIFSIVLGQINAMKGQNYFPFIYVLFSFVLVNNLIGMTPYTFSPTSHLVLTFFFSFTVVIGATVLGLVTHYLYFFSAFVPEGCPLGLLPLLVLIEFISYISRCVSLGLRLGANVLSGHMLLNILSGFTFNIMKGGLLLQLLGLVPLSFIIAFSGLEVGICFIQSQVFCVLSSSYIRDGVVTH